jgi:hypothetical protein
MIGPPGWQPERELRMCFAFRVKQYTETRNKDTLVENLREIMARKAI